MALARPGLAPGSSTGLSPSTRITRGFASAGPQVPSGSTEAEALGWSRESTLKPPQGCSELGGQRRGRASRGRALPSSLPPTVEGSSWAPLTSLPCPGLGTLLAGRLPLPEDFLLMDWSSHTYWQLAPTRPPPSLTSLSSPYPSSALRQPKRGARALSGGASSIWGTAPPTPAPSSPGARLRRQRTGRGRAGTKVMPPPVGQSPGVVGHWPPRAHPLRDRLSPGGPR